MDKTYLAEDPHHLVPLELAALVDMNLLRYLLSLSNGYSVHIRRSSLFMQSPVYSYDIHFMRSMMVLEE